MQQPQGRPDTAPSASPSTASHQSSSSRRGLGQKRDEECDKETLGPTFRPYTSKSIQFRRLFLHLSLERGKSTYSTQLEKMRH